MSKHVHLIPWLTRDLKLLHNLIELLLSEDPQVVGDILTLFENALNIKVRLESKIYSCIRYL